MEFSDGLAIAAIALALSGIFFGVLFYKWQSELAMDMHGVLSKIEGLTMSTHGSIESTILPLVSMLGKVPEEQPVASGKALAGAAEEAQRDMERWRVERAEMVLGTLPAGPAMLEYLAEGIRETVSASEELFALGPQRGWQKESWDWQVAAAVAVLIALDFLRVDPKKSTLWLTPEGKELAARLSEGADD